MHVRPGGPMAGVIEALLRPRLQRTIEDFAGALAGRIETGRSVRR